MGTSKRILLGLLLVAFAVAFAGCSGLHTICKNCEQQPAAPAASTG